MRTNAVKQAEILIDSEVKLQRKESTHTLVQFFCTTAYIVTQKEVSYCIILFLKRVTKAS